jgi:hypothetical protein
VRNLLGVAVPSSAHNLVWLQVLKGLKKGKQLYYLYFLKIQII